MGVVAALALEARTLGPAVRRRDGLFSLGEGALLCVGGMGHAAAGAAALRLIDAGAAALLSFGLAGGLDPSLCAGSVVLPREVISGDGERLLTAEDWRQRLHVVISGQRAVSAGALLSRDGVIEAVAAKSKAFRETGAVAVDMESLAVAEVAARHELPFVAVRVVVDTASDALPRAVAAASHAGEVNVWRLIGGVAGAPRDLIGLIRLAQRYRAARRSLAAVARSGVLIPLFAAPQAA